MARARCERCGFPAGACLCHALQPEAFRVVVGVLRHPKEARVAKGTGRLLRLAASNAFLIDGVDLDGDAALASSLPGGTVEGAAILFPEDAEPIERAPKDLRCLLVPDGSWSQARSILASTRSLAGVPRYALPPDVQGTYRIRKPQGPGRVSTLEAAVWALRIIEGRPDAYQGALDLLEAMQAGQLAQMRAGGARHPALGTGRWGGG